MKHLARDIMPKVLEALDKFPIVAIIGPQLSGKTTLCLLHKPKYTYINLKDFSLRNFAKNDPKGIKRVKYIIIHLLYMTT